MSGPIPFRRLHGLLVSLHPKGFRKRYGSDTRALFVEWVASGSNPKERRERGKRGVLDALKSLVQCWALSLSGSSPGRQPTGGSTMDTVTQALRTTFRFLKRRPMQGVVVIGTLTLALGVNTTFFAVARALFIRDLPYRDSEDVVHVVGSAASLNEDFTFGIDQEITSTPGIQDAALFVPAGWGNLAGTGGASRVSLAQVSPEFFRVLGVDLPLGPGFSAAGPGEAVAVISQGLWRRAFGSDPDVLERDLVLNGKSFRVVGIAPPEVGYPGDTEAWLSFPPFWEFFGNAVTADVVVRVQPGTDVAVVESTLNQEYEPRRARDLEQYGFDSPPLRLVPIREYLVRDVSRPLLVLMAAAFLVLALGALNLAGVWVSRILERLEELGMRRALGASRTTLFGQLIGETVLLSLLGGMLALGVSWAGTRFFRSYLPGDLPGVSAIGMDPLTLAAAFGLTLLAGVGFGVIAALRGARTESLCRGRDVSQGREGRRLQTTLAVAQGALALVLTVGATLSVRSFLNLHRQQLGFDPAVSLVMQVRLPPSTEGSASAPLDYGEALRARLLEIPGVESVGLTSALPFAAAGGVASYIRVPGRGTEEGIIALSAAASPGYFEAAGIDVREGFPFGESAREANTDIVIDESLSAQLFPGVRAADRWVEVQSVRGEWTRARVRGVVAGVRLGGAKQDGIPLLYRSYASYPSSVIGAVIRTAGPPGQWLDEVRRAAREVDPTVAPFGLRTMREAASETMGMDRALAVVTSGFSILAILLAGLGLYGLVARQVTLRRRELGLRLALGADPGALVRSMTGSGLAIGALALLLGFPATLMATRILEGTLFQVGAMDPASLALGCALLLLLSWTGAWIPARGAARIDPREALEEE